MPSKILTSRIKIILNYQPEFLNLLLTFFLPAAHFISQVICIFSRLKCAGAASKLFIQQVSHGMMGQK